MSRITIKNARLAFPNLWKPRPGKDGGKEKFGALLIIDPKNPIVPEIRKAMAAVAKEKWGTKADVIMKQLMAQDRLALHDGATKAQYDGFEGNLFVSANSDTRPSVVDRNRAPLTAGDGKVYAGCYVVGLIELWAQDSSEYGKRINAQLRGIQFDRDGDAFAAGKPASEDEFEDLGEQGEEAETEVDPTS